MRKISKWRKKKKFQIVNIFIIRFFCQNHSRDFVEKKSNCRRFRQFASEFYLLSKRKMSSHVFENRIENFDANIWRQYFFNMKRFIVICSQCLNNDDRQIIFQKFVQKFRKRRKIFFWISFCFFLKMNILRNRNDYFEKRIVDRSRDRINIDKSNSNHLFLF